MSAGVPVLPAGIFFDADRREATREAFEPPALPRSFMRQDIVAPQYGVWSAFAPMTDNPAAQPPKPAPSVLARLRVLRDQALERAAEQARRAPEVWRL